MENAQMPTKPIYSVKSNNDVIKQGEYIDK